MHKGQAHYIPEIIISVFIGVMAYFFFSSYLSEASSSKTPISDAAFSQSFDDFFLTFLQTPVPDYSSISSTQRACFTSFPAGAYTFGDILSRAATLPEDERLQYLEPFRCYFQLAYRAIDPGYSLMLFYLRVTLPDSTSYAYGLLSDWKEKPAMSAYLIPAQDGNVISVEVVGRMLT